MVDDEWVFFIVEVLVCIGEGVGEVVVKLLNYKNELVCIFVRVFFIVFGDPNFILYLVKFLKSKYFKEFIVII